MCQVINIVYLVQYIYISNILLFIILTVQFWKVPVASHLPTATAPPLSTPLTQPIITTSGVNITTSQQRIPSTRYTTLTSLPPGTKLPTGNLKVTIPGVKSKVASTSSMNVSTSIPVTAVASTVTSTTAGLLPTPTTVAPKIIIRMPRGAMDSVTSTSTTMDRSLAHRSLTWDATRGPMPNVVTTDTFRALAAHPRRMVSTVVTMGSTTVVTWSWQPRYNEPNTTWSDDQPQFSAVKISSNLPLTSTSLITSASITSTVTASLLSTVPTSSTLTSLITPVTSAINVPMSVDEDPVVISDDDISQSSTQSVRELVQQAQSSEAMDTDAQFLDIVAEEIPISAGELSDISPQNPQ